MKEYLMSDIELYKKSLVEKTTYLQNLKQVTAKTEAEITMLNGALQACEKLLENIDGFGKAD